MKHDISIWKMAADIRDEVASVNRQLYLATDGQSVYILRGLRRFVDRQARKYGLTILTSEEGELEQLVARGALVCETPEPLTKSTISVTSSH